MTRRHHLTRGSRDPQRKTRGTAITAPSTPLGVVGDPLRGVDGRGTGMLTLPGIGTGPVFEVIGGKGEEYGPRFPPY